MRRTEALTLVKSYQMLSIFFFHQGPVVQRVDSTIHWINHYPMDNSINFDSTYPLDSDLSSG